MKTLPVTVFFQKNVETGETNVALMATPLGSDSDYRIDSDDDWRKAPLQRFDLVLTGSEEAINAVIEKELRSVR